MTACKSRVTHETTSAGGELNKIKWHPSTVHRVVKAPFPDISQTLKAWPQVHPPWRHLPCFKILKVKRTTGTPCQGIRTAFILSWHQSIRERGRKKRRGVKGRRKKNKQQVGTEPDWVKLVQVRGNGGLSKQFDQNKIRVRTFASELVMPWKNINTLEAHLWKNSRKAESERCGCLALNLTLMGAASHW